MDSNRNIGMAHIELYQQLGDKDYNWCHIEHNPRTVLVGMYEDGEVARSLFFMNKAQVKQLANTLIMLSETMEDTKL